MDTATATPDEPDIRSGSLGTRSISETAVSASALKLVRCPRSLAPTLVALPSMSLIPSAPFSFLRLTQPPLRVFRGEQETFNRLTLNESIHNLGDVGDCDAPVKKVIGFD
jgi:hypothetical protein